MKNLIVTHSGSAHFDEFLAISLVLAAHKDTSFIIERRDPLEKELNDPQVWVIDIGGRYEPDLKNFDHHQDLDIGSSFVLVADYLGLTEMLSKNTWWQFQNRLDRFGPFQLAKEEGIESLIPVFSPFEKWFLTIFETSPLMVYQIMLMFGQGLIEQAEKLKRGINFWKNCQQIILKNRLVVIGLTDDNTGLQEYHDSLAPTAKIAITYDSRGSGWKMYRFNDDKDIDFSRVENHKDVVFAHKGGFIAKTAKRIPLKEVFKLIELAIVDDE